MKYLVFAAFILNINVCFGAEPQCSDLTTKDLQTITEDNLIKFGGGHWYVDSFYFLIHEPTGTNFPKDVDSTYLKSVIKINTSEELSKNKCIYDVDLSYGKSLQQARIVISKRGEVEAPIVQ